MFTNTSLLQTFQAQVHGRSCIADFIQGGLRGSGIYLSPTPTSPNTQQLRDQSHRYLLCAVQDYAGVTKQPVEHEKIHSPHSAGRRGGAFRCARPILGLVLACSCYFDTSFIISRGLKDEKLDLYWARPVPKLSRAETALIVKTSGI